MTAKKTYITVLNVYSCLSVVLLHGSAFWNFRKTPGWIADNFVESFFYFAVPVFVMLSGATLMDYRERCTTKEYFKKRVRKTVIPFLFWSIVGLFFVIWRDGSGSVDLHPVAILDAVINCRYIGIYYFFIIIFGVYLAIPVFSAIPKEKRQRTFLYCILAALAVNVLLPFLASLTGGAVRHNGEFTFAVCSGYLLYVLVGYYLDAYMPSRKVRIPPLSSRHFGGCRSLFGNAVSFLQGRCDQPAVQRLCQPTLRAVRHCRFSVFQSIYV